MRRVATEQTRDRHRTRTTPPVGAPLRARDGAADHHGDAVPRAATTAQRRTTSDGRCQPATIVDTPVRPAAAAPRPDERGAQARRVRPARAAATSDWHDRGVAAGQAVERAEPRSGRSRSAVLEHLRGHVGAGDHDDGGEQPRRPLAQRRPRPRRHSTAIAIVPIDDVAEDGQQRQLGVAAARTTVRHRLLVVRLSARGRQGDAHQHERGERQHEEAERRHQVVRGGLCPADGARVAVGDAMGSTCLIAHHDRHRPDRPRHEPVQAFQRVRHIGASSAGPDRSRRHLSPLRAVGASTLRCASAMWLVCAFYRLCGSEASRLTSPPRRPCRS